MKLKQKLTVLGTAVLMTATMVVPAAAATPRYQPISTQSWYISMQENLNKISGSESSDSTESSSTQSSSSSSGSFGLSLAQSVLNQIGS